MLDPDALTIGYARRFTAYKRPELIFHDAERLARILTAAKRPGADRLRRQGASGRRPGEASPAAGVPPHARPDVPGRIAFIDDYDMHVAHCLVAGCDVWLNNPRKPLEASGTSGMKASLNGVPHLSIGDGWWAEGFNGRNGWLIESRAEPDDHAATDAADAEALYRLLEEQVVPAFYERDERLVPRRWVQIVREAMRSNLPRFSARRMVKQYVNEMYAPAAAALTLTAVGRQRERQTRDAGARFGVPLLPRREDLVAGARSSVRSPAARVRLRPPASVSAALHRASALARNSADVATAVATWPIVSALVLSAVSRLVW